MTRVEFGNCIDCVFSDPSSKIKNVDSVEVVDVGRI